MKPEEQARRQAIVNGHAPPPQAPSLSQILDQQPVAAIRILQATKVIFLPASPLERPDHAPQFAELEMHLITLGDTERQVFPMPLEVAEWIHTRLGDAIERARRNRDPHPENCACDQCVGTDPFHGAPAGDIENDGDQVEEPDA